MIGSDASAKRPTGPHRRGLLQGALGAALIPALGLASRASAADSPLTVSDLPGGLVLISGAGTNVVVAKGADGAVMVDCGAASRAAELAALVKKRTGQAKVATLFNTCWRLEQTGGNDAFGASGAQIVSHENTRLWMGTEIVSHWEDKTYPARAPVARPTKTFYAMQDFGAGSGAIGAGYLLQAHTDGDIYVHFRKANVLVAGSATVGRGWPVIDWSTDGWIGGHVRGLETLMGVADDKTVIVPADGPVLTKADLKAQHDIYVPLMDKIETIKESGQGQADVLKARLLAPYEAERGDPTPFLIQAYRSFWGHQRQFKAV
jgi:glyoxylase-like metal-dependent hydrolase (beta-lactamase superfamily II)